MRVSSFKVSNYRSIDSAEVDLADLTCLVGPNNEGKSNLLRALGLGLNVALDPDAVRFGLVRTARQRPELIGYDPATDRPALSQSRALTTITVRFELTEGECEDFREEIGHSLNGDLPVQVQFTGRGQARLQVKKQRVGSLLTEKSEAVSRFLSQRFTFQYVPAIRTAEDAANVIGQLIRNRLNSLRLDKDYLAAEKVINTKSAEALSAVEVDLMEVLPRFLPRVASVHIETETIRASIAYDRGVRSIQVDDGVTTELATKGSGVQSLAALALLRHRTTSASSNRSSLLALEEPEAHLHSGALHQLRPLLTEIAAEQQLVFATHSGVLVPTDPRASRVIVRDNHAQTSRSLADVRAALGIRLSDNLQSARLVIIVEGADDIRFWTRTLGDSKDAIADALEAGLLVFESAAGASNLSYMLQNLHRSACDALVVFDGDDPGRSAVNKALADESLNESDYLLLSWEGQSQAELEDLLDGTWVSTILEKHLGVEILIEDGKSKWSDRLRPALTAAGKSNSKATVASAKVAIWESFAALRAPALSPMGSTIVDRVRSLVRQRLGTE